MFEYNYQTESCWCDLYLIERGPTWSWSHGSWTYNYLCKQCLSPVKLWVRIPLIVRG